MQPEIAVSRNRAAVERHAAADAIVILDVFAKTTQKTPKTVIEVCKARLRRYASIRE